MKFEDYKIGRDYENAHMSKIQLPEEEMKKINKWLNVFFSNTLLFMGNSGVGKTYLCAAMLNFFLEKQAIPRYMTEQSFFTHLRVTIQKGWDYTEEIQRLAETNIFILDDIGSSQGSEWQTEVLFSFIDIRTSNGSPTIITTNTWSKDLKDKFGERIASRLLQKKNTIIEINGVDKRQELF